MIKTLQRQGSGQVLPNDKATMEAMGIHLDTPLQVTVTGNVLMVTPVHVGLSREEIALSLAKLRGHYGQTLRNLAAGPSDR